MPKNPNIVSHKDILESYGQAKPKQKREMPTGKESYHMWQVRLAAALRWRQAHWNGDQNWKRAYKSFGGKHWKFQDEENPSADSARDLITVNVTMSMVNNMVPFLVNSNPMFVLKPRKPGDNVSASLQQEVLNYEFKIQKCLNQIKDSVLDATNIGHGICKTGFTYELDEASTEADGNIVYDDFIKEETAYIKRVDPFCFIYDPTAPDRTLATARWCAEIYYQHFDDIVANESYSSSVRAKIKSGEYGVKPIEVVEEYGSAFANDDQSMYQDINENAPRLVRLFEIWDKKHKKRMVMAEGVDDPLIEQDWPYDYLKGFPYRRLDYIKIPNEHYPVGMPYTFEDQQYELDRKRTEMFQHARRFNRKYRGSDKIDQKEGNKLIDGEDGTVIYISDDLRLEPIEDAPLPNDIWQIEGIIKQDIYELSGMDALIRGGSLPSRTTGTEVNARTNIFRMKIDDLVYRTDEFVIDLAGDFLKHLKANLLKERVIQIVGQQGLFWVRMNNEDIQAEIDISMESIAAPRTDPTLDKQQALQLLQISAQLQAQAAQSGQQIQIDLNELFAWVLEKFGYKDVGRFFIRALQPTPPLQEGQGQGSNNLISPNGTTPQSPMNAADLQNQFGIASIMNANGLQQGGQ